jgi:holin-like protein
MIKSAFIIFACLAAGEFLVKWGGMPVPACILGMLLLTALLQMRVVRPESVRPLCRLLIQNIGLFFVPAGVGLMIYFDLIRASLLPIIAATIISTALVLIATSLTHTFLRRHGRSVRK